MQCRARYVYIIWHVAKTAILAECGDNEEVRTIISDLDDLEYWLTLTVKRLETRQ